MCSELTPCAHIPDTRIPQLMQPWTTLSSNFVRLGAGKEARCWTTPRCEKWFWNHQITGITNYHTPLPMEARRLGRSACHNCGLFSLLGLVCWLLDYILLWWNIDGPCFGLGFINSRWSYSQYSKVTCASHHGFVLFYDHSGSVQQWLTLLYWQWWSFDSACCLS